MNDGTKAECGCVRDLDGRCAPCGRLHAEALAAYLEASRAFLEASGTLDRNVAGFCKPCWKNEYEETVCRTVRKLWDTFPREARPDFFRSFVRSMAQTSGLPLVVLYQAVEEEIRRDLERAV